MKPPDQGPRAPRKRFGVLLGIAVAIGIIIMLLSGGCVLLFSVAARGGFHLALGYALPPFLIGLVIVLAALTAGR